MSPNEATMATFEARMRQLILQFQSLKEENKELYAMLEKSEEEKRRRKIEKFYCIFCRQALY